MRTQPMPAKMGKRGKVRSIMVGESLAERGEGKKGLFAESDVLVACLPSC